MYIKCKYVIYNVYIGQYNNKYTLESILMFLYIAQPCRKHTACPATGVSRGELQIIFALYHFAPASQAAGHELKLSDLIMSCRSERSISPLQRRRITDFPNEKAASSAEMKPVYLEGDQPMDRSRRIKLVAIDGERKVLDNYYTCRRKTN